MKSARRKLSPRVAGWKSPRELTARQIAMDARGFYLAGQKPTNYSDEWYTPPYIVRALGKFDLDPSASPQTRHARRNIRAPRDGLKAAWKGRVWLNPPYSNVHDWLARFVGHGNGIALVNARCETGWFQRLSDRADAILFLKGRIQFERPNAPAGHPPCGSALVAYGARNAAALRNSGLPGVLVTPIAAAPARPKAAPRRRADAKRRAGKSAAGLSA